MLECRSPFNKRIKSTSAVDMTLMRYTDKKLNGIDYLIMKISQYSTLHRFYY